MNHSHKDVEHSMQLMFNWGLHGVQLAIVPIAIAGLLVIVIVTWVFNVPPFMY
jgi:hypothetical protein